MFFYCIIFFTFTKIKSILTTIIFLSEIIFVHLLYFYFILLHQSSLFLHFYYKICFFKALCRTVYGTERTCICHTCGTYSAEFITTVLMCHIRLCNLVA